MEKVVSRKASRSLFGESAGILQECHRVVRVANPALAIMGPITFYPGLLAVGDRFSEWLNGIFQQEILPGLLTAVQLAGDEKGRELLELDKLILTGLTPMVRESSARAGRILLRQGIPVGVKCLKKLEAAALDGSTGAHFVTVFGARCGIFSIGQQAAALAYVFQELHLGAPDWHDQIMQEKLVDASEVIEEVLQNGCAFPGTKNPFAKGSLHG